MDTTKTNSVPEEQFDNAQNVAENAVNAAENAAETVITPEISDNNNDAKVEETASIVNDVVDEIETEVERTAEDAVDLSSEEAQLAADSEEFSLENDGEVDAEEDSEVSTNFAVMSKIELLNAFRNELETKPVEQMRKDVDAIKTAFYKLIRPEQDAHKQAYLAAGNSIENYVAPMDKDEIEFKALFNSYKIKRSAYLRNLEGEKEENYKKKLALIEELKLLVDKKENINQTFHEFKDLQNKWREIGPIPQIYSKDLWETYNHHIDNFYDLLKINKELRDMDFKKNLETKIQLCEKTEELLLEPSIVTAFRKLQKYHEQWREIGPVANELKEQIWERFKEATSKINKKHQEYFESQKDIQEQNLKAKTVLCEKAEELLANDIKSNKDWNKASKALIELQKTWKTIGFASKKDNSKVYERFRKACDEFFSKKREFYSEFKSVMDENLKKKIELCEKAEELCESTDWKKTAEQLMQLQKDWREIGVVPRKVSNDVWKRFRSACDKFFTARKDTFKEQDSRYDDNLKAKETIIQEIKEYQPSDDAVKNLEVLKEFQRRWAEIGFVPMKEKTRIQNEYRSAIDNLFNLLNISEKDRKIVKFRTRLENMQSGKGQVKTLRNEREKLLTQIRQIESDIAVWENNIGFFAKSKNAESVVAEVQRKIKKSREEVVVLEEKIKLLDETT